MLRLSDTTIRLYRKHNGRASYRLLGFLLVNTNAGFNLNAYLRDISCRLTWASGMVVPFEEISITENLMLKYELNTMAHGFHAIAESAMPRQRKGLGTLRIDYHISFTNHYSEKPKYFELVVPITSIDRT